MKRLLGSRWLGFGSTRRARVALGLLVFLGWFASVLYWSKRLEPSNDELPRLEAVEAVEPVVLAVAAEGIGQLSGPDQRARLQSAANEPALLALFAAWAKLSLGRQGLIEPTTCARLPWLVLCALGPALLYRVLRPLRGALVALVGAAVLASALLYGGGGAALREVGTSVGWLLFVLTPYSTTLQPLRSARARQCSAVMAALALAFAVALSRSALWAAFICVAHLPLARWAATRRAARRGRFPLPSFVFLGLALSLPLLLLLNPQLWGATPVQIAAFVLGPLGAAGPTPPSQLEIQGLRGWLQEPALLVLVALVGAGFELAGARARRRPLTTAGGSRDRSALLALVAVGLAVTLLLPWALPAPLRALAPARAGAWPFLAIAAALAVGGARDLALRASHARAKPAPPHST